MKFKFSKMVCVLAALSGLASTAAMAQANPNRVTPADSRGYSHIATKLVIPVPVDMSPYVQRGELPAAIASNGPSGSYCGRMVVYLDNNNVTANTPCGSYYLSKDVTSQVYYYPTVGYTVYDANGSVMFTIPDDPGGYRTVTYNVRDCPASYALSLTGGAGPYAYYACVKA